MGHKYTSYQEFEKEKILCRNCPIGRVYNRVVLSDGNKINPQVVIVGECPGSTEIELGLPFIGKAGQLLREYLRKYGFNKKNTLITNTIPCRPEANKFPTTAESISYVENCVNNWVLEELRILSPDFILFLGAQSLKYVGKRTGGISKERGNPFYLSVGDKMALCMPTYHPSFVIRKQHMQEGKEVIAQFESDLQFISKKMRK